MNIKLGIYIRLNISKPCTQTLLDEIKIMGICLCHYPPPLFTTTMKMIRKKMLFIWKKLGFLPLI